MWWQNQCAAVEASGDPGATKTEGDIHWRRRRSIYHVQESGATCDYPRDLDIPGRTIERPILRRVFLFTFRSPTN